ncbi:hypothetical protein CASFOL_011291 [Castilleja foliolosa]|uniref:Uncharacterized protein n=1 Tax=Castilleja foliolosa TaxID=1961234 RepID=A0ABD3DWG2_9LAMI
MERGFMASSVKVGRVDCGRRFAAPISSGNRIRTTARSSRRKRAIADLSKFMGNGARVHGFFGHGGSSRLTSVGRKEQRGAPATEAEVRDNDWSRFSGAPATSNRCYCHPSVPSPFDFFAFLLHQIHPNLIGVKNRYVNQTDDIFLNNSVVFTVQMLGVKLLSTFMLPHGNFSSTYFLHIYIQKSASKFALHIWSLHQPLFRRNRVPTHVFNSDAWSLTFFRLHCFAIWHHHLASQIVSAELGFRRWFSNRLLPPLFVDVFGTPLPFDLGFRRRFPNRICCCILRIRVSRTFFSSTAHNFYFGICS